MKKTLIRLLALLMALSCAFTLFGCAEEEETSSRRRRKNRQETTEEYAQPEDFTGVREEPETTAQYHGQKDEKVESAVDTTKPQKESAVERHADPGSIQLPACELFSYSFGMLQELNWDSTETWSDERWIMQCTIGGTRFTFVFEGEYKAPDAKPVVLSVDDLDGSSRAYISYDIQLGDAADIMPNEVADMIDPMDGGFYAELLLYGIPVTLMFHEAPNMDPGHLYFAQFRQEG